ncbi:metal-dependent hydrolase [Alkalihalobacillus macyae]|uniref:metal-dependent hydrolase n=1 Tax=Guptibacillus hwajinpoensis TaxID=208199 RepID=UPI00273C87B1|nr:metal-dependent hydrolase [Alkalihalobacillus macyae]MDP4549918.1 metal-dependent hydrolase [Alkalihalobacillus macyae]
MEGKTHAIGGICLGIATQSYYITQSMDAPETIVYYGACLLGSLLPDICHPGSWTGRRARVLSKGISRFFGHRTITHSILFILLIYWLTSTFSFQYDELIQTGLLVGIVSHLLLDAMTVRGIQLFYPITIRVRFPMYMKTASKAEGIVSSILVGSAIFLIYKQLFA